MRDARRATSGPGLFFPKRMAEQGVDAKAVCFFLSLVALVSGPLGLVACHGGEHTVTIERNQPGGGGSNGGGGY